AWVRSGGSLLLEGAAAAALPEFDALLDSTGVPLRYEAGAGITGPTTRIYPFEITRDVVAADMPSSTARLRATGAGAAVLIEDAQGLPTLGASFVGRGRVLAVAGRLFADVSSIFADNRRVASQAFGWLGGAAWLSVAPGSGTTTAGQSATVTVAFDAAQLAGADYRGALAVRTNDPDRSDLLVPVDLSVTPAPDAVATPASLDLGTVFVGASRLDSLRVRNVGVLPLHVSSAAMDHPDFAAAFDSLTLTPGASVMIPVRYAPASVGPASATLTVTTDDPDQPEIRIGVRAAGAPPPDVDVVAGPVGASLPTGGTATRTITVANRSGSDLQYAIRFEEEAPPSSSPAASAAPMAALPRTWAEARESARSLQGRVTPLATGAAGALAAASDSLPLVILDPQGDGSVEDLVALRAWARGGVLSVRIETATDIAPLNFGGYVSLDLDQNRNTGREPSFGTPRQDIGTEFEVSLFSVGYGMVDLLDALTGNYVQSFPVQVGPRSLSFAIPLSWLDGDDGRINATGVIGNFVGATDWFPDRGHGTIGGLWLAASPHEGTLTAGSETPIALTLDALSLPGGAYHGTIVVESNDPDEPTLEVPASLDVTDAPVAVVTATAVHFGTVFLGRASEAELAVGNEGRAPLTVSSVASDLSDFTAAPTSFTVEPGAVQTIRLTFTPAAGGPREGTLTIAHDAAGGPIAIAVTGAGRVPPVVQVAPASLQASIGLGERSATSFSIRNTGGSALDYGVEPLNGAPAVAVQAGLALARDEEDPRPGIAPPAALGLGGPDGFGYRWVDSNQPGGPVYDWQDIAAIGTPIPIQNLDQNSGPLPIGFPFPFYGHDFTTFNVCTHGWISFTDTTVQFANQPLPTTAAPNNLLAVYWDDLNFGGVQRAVYYNDGTRLIVQFTNVPRRQRGGPFTFQAILYPTGAIVYQYRLMGPPLDSGTIGIQNRTKTDGLTVVFNAAYLHDGMAVRFSAAPSWLNVAQRFGSVDPGDSASVAVALESRGLFAGDYHGTLRIQTNDPARPETLLPVLLHATGIPRLAFRPASFRFDTLDVGQSAADTLRLTNSGTDRLDVALSFDRPDYAADPASLSLAPLQSAPVLVRFSPTAGGDRSGALTLTTNDPETPSAAIPLTGAGRLSVRELAAELVPGVIRRGSKGREIRARIVFPADLDAGAVDLAGIRLQGSVAALADSHLRDLNGDGRPDLDLAFDRGAVERALPNGNAVPVSITGQAGGIRFEAQGTVRVLGSAVAAAGVEFDEDLIPAANALRASAPNPFAAATTLRFDLADGGAAALRVYTAGGRLVRTVFQAPLPAGRFRALWDGRDDRGLTMPSGVYFTRLEVSGPSPFRGVGRIVRIR
ncbi:MAG TPA: choice-of-anchor D domain-containing protein, partial [Candidatus Omnitrophota bacterium]|nr:choice-of-anchor D domain-containing protein [Candidatus Omnitrophota bacterium]